SGGSWRGSPEHDVEGQAVGSGAADGELHVPPAARAERDAIDAVLPGTQRPGGGDLRSATHRVRLPRLDGEGSAFHYIAFRVAQRDPPALRPVPRRLGRRRERRLVAAFM